MPCHVEGQLDAGLSHARAAGAEEPRGQVRLQRLMVMGVSLRMKHHGAQLVDEFSGQHVAAGFAGNEHDAFGSHAMIRRVVCRTGPTSRGFP